MNSSASEKEKDSLIDRISNAIFQIIIADVDSTYLEEVGTAFVISKGQKEVYALTATHTVLSFVERIKVRTRQGYLSEKMRHLPFSDDSVNPEVNVFDSELVLAVFKSESFEGALHVKRIHVRECCDIALLVLGGGDIDSIYEYINFLPLSTCLYPYNKVSAVAIKFKNNPKFEMHDDDKGRLLISDFRIHYDRGLIIEPKDSIVPGDTFATDICFDFGMSGAPIFDEFVSQINENMVVPIVCGIVSASHIEGGYSVCSCISSAFSLEISDDGTQTVLDWIRQGKIHYRGISPKHWMIVNGSGVAICMLSNSVCGLGFEFPPLNIPPRILCGIESGIFYA